MNFSGSLGLEDNRDGWVGRGDVTRNEKVQPCVNTILLGWRTLQIRQVSWSQLERSPCAPTECSVEAPAIGETAARPGILARVSFRISSYTQALYLDTLGSNVETVQRHRESLDEWRMRRTRAPTDEADRGEWRAALLEDQDGLGHMLQQGSMDGHIKARE